MLNGKQYLSRKDLAQLLDLSVASIRRNEANLGLSAARRNVNQRVVVYVRWEVETALRARRLLPPK